MPIRISLFLRWIVLIFCLLGFDQASFAGGNPATPASWSVGFWIWQWVAEDNRQKTEPLDVLYILVGRVDDLFRSSISWNWPKDLPAAREYWAVWRYTPPVSPAEVQIAVLVGDYKKRREEALAQDRKVVGLQLDYDCPTADLAEYARFLEALGKALPLGTRISITTLLDWFRPGTEIGLLLAHTSEFVPQFYDIGENFKDQPQGIAEAVDINRWAPILNSFRVPYRIGISTFGRISLTEFGRTVFARDVALLDILGKPDLPTILKEKTTAGEQRMILKAVRPTWINNKKLRSGDQIELTLPTQESVLAGYTAAQKMGGYCTGVLFFRWPRTSESLVLHPRQILEWTTHSQRKSMPPTIEAFSGNCVAVHCWDLQLQMVDRFPEHPLRLRIRSSQPLEYFLPAINLKTRARMTGPGAIQIELPAYHGVGQLHLGRAVTVDSTRFTVEVVP